MNTSEPRERSSFTGQLTSASPPVCGEGLVFLFSICHGSVLLLTKKKKGRNKKSYVSLRVFKKYFRNNINKITFC